MSKGNMISLLILAVFVFIVVSMALYVPREKYVLTYDIVQYNQLYDQWTTTDKCIRSSFNATSLDDAIYQAYELESYRKPFVVDSIYVVSSVIIK